MATIRVEPGKLGLVLRKDKGNIPKVVLQAMRAAAERARAHLVRLSPVDRGLLKNAWRIQRGPGFVELVNNAPYAGVIERGARPHPVSAEGWLAIYRWVLRKFKSQIRFVTQRKQQGPLPQGARRAPGRKQADVAAEITDRIVWKIQKFGQKGRFIVRDSMPTLQKWSAQMIAEAVQKYFAGGGGAK